MSTVFIIVIDNNSPSPYKINEKWAGVICIRNKSKDAVNGMNFGFYHALYKLDFQPKYIVYADNDIIFLKNWLSPMIKSMERDGLIGTVGGKQWDKEEKNFRSVCSDLSGTAFSNKPIERQYVLTMTGAMVMYRAEMMRMIGLHDDRYITMCSDCDYNIHAQERGWKVLFEPDSNVIHKISGSYNGNYVSNPFDRRKFVAKWYGATFNDLVRNVPIEITRTANLYAETEIKYYEKVQKNTFTKDRFSN